MVNMVFFSKMEFCEESRQTMNFERKQIFAWMVLLGAAAALTAQAPETFVGPVQLQVDNLHAPLGIDDATPKFSWQLHDPARGATQTAYEVQVASRPEFLASGHADVWTSGRISSGQSIAVPYAGPPLQPSTRYYWRVKLWGAADKDYAPSETSWWETGLMHQDAWRAQWIGYETPEEAAVRHAPAAWIANPDPKSSQAETGAEQHFDYRTTITLAQPVRFAALYATGQDTVAAWVNGKQVLSEDPLTPYRQMPWKKFVRRRWRPI